MILVSNCNNEKIGGSGRLPLSLATQASSTHGGANAVGERATVEGSPSVTASRASSPERGANAVGERATVEGERSGGISDSRRRSGTACTLGVRSTFGGAVAKRLSGRRSFATLANLSKTCYNIPNIKWERRDEIH